MDGKYWVSKISINGKQVTLGSFNSEQECALAYNKAAVKHFGEFANLNIITNNFINYNYTPTTFDILNINDRFYYPYKTKMIECTVIEKENSYIKIKNENNTQINLSKYQVNRFLKFK